MHWNVFFMKLKKENTMLMIKRKNGQAQFNFTEWEISSTFKYS